MKDKLPPRKILIAFLLVASFSSYLFLNSSVRKPTVPVGIESPLEMYQEQNEIPAHKPLPDLLIFRKLMEIGKRFVPAI